MASTRRSLLTCSPRRAVADLLGPARRLLTARSSKAAWPRRSPKRSRTLASLLESEGSGLEDVVKTTVFLTDMADFAAMNDAYVAAFGDNRPARSAFAVAGLPLGALVEIEAWAYMSRSPASSAD